MSTRAITSLQRSVDMLLARIGTSDERQPDKEMIDYLRCRIAEIEDAHKKAAGPQVTAASANHDSIVTDDQSTGNHRSRKRGEA